MPGADSPCDTCRFVELQSFGRIEQKVATDAKTAHRIPSRPWRASVLLLLRSFGFFQSSVLSASVPLRFSHFGYYVAAVVRRDAPYGLFFG
jgi:hypothetical protein